MCNAARSSLSILVDAIQQNLPRAQRFYSPGKLHSIDVAPLAPALHRALPPAAVHAMLLQLCAVPSSFVALAARIAAVLGLLQPTHSPLFQLQHPHVMQHAQISGSAHMCTCLTL